MKESFTTQTPVSVKSEQKPSKRKSKKLQDKIATAIQLKSSEIKKQEAEIEQKRLESIRSQLSSVYGNGRLLTAASNRKQIIPQNTAIFGKIPLNTPVWTKDDPLGFESLRNTYRKNETSSAVELCTAFSSISDFDEVLKGKTFYSTDDLSSVCKAIVEALGGTYEVVQEPSNT